MSDDNGNGFVPLDIDVSDEHSFRSAVVQHLQMISDRTACIPALRKKVDKHEDIVKFGKWLSVPVVIVIHAMTKKILATLGLN